MTLVRHLRSQACFEYVPWPQNKVWILQHGAWDNANGSFGITFFLPPHPLLQSYRTVCLWHFCIHALPAPRHLQLMETPAPIRPHSCLWLDIWAAVPHQAVICLLFCTWCLYTSQFWLFITLDYHYLYKCLSWPQTLKFLRVKTASSRYTANVWGMNV